MQSAPDITMSNALPARLPKGFVLGGYVVDGWLRDGGMAAIYRARRASDEQRVALKLQLPSTAHDPTICARFDREAEVMRRANGSPHVVELFDAGVFDDGRRYFVMEWVEGENLEELLDFLRNQDQRLPLARACRIGRDVARGLVELHEHGVLHLDLKPANVMVAQGRDGGDEIKLVDFGIAADLREAPADEAAQAPVMGTSGYMSPEQVQGQPSNPSFDVYALGVLLFESLSGSAVPRDGWKPETLPQLESLRRGVPGALAELVRSCMDFDPGRRPASATVVVTELVRIIRALEADGGRGRMVSSEEIPVRSGGTEIVPHASVAGIAGGAEAPVRTGGTEVRLTHEEVLISSGMATALSSEAIEVARRGFEREQKEGERPRSWMWWAVLGGVGVLLLAGGVWLARGGGEAAPVEAVAMGPVPVEVAVASASERVASPELVAPTKPSDRGAVGDDGPAAVVSDAKAGLAAADDEEEKPSSAEAPDVAPEPSPASSTPREGPSAEACKKARAEAVEAKQSRTWPKVLKVTATRACWTTGGQRLERKQLRVQAYAELGEFGKCVDEGGKARDGQIEARVKFCRKQLGGGGA